MEATPMKTQQQTSETPTTVTPRYAPSSQASAVLADYNALRERRRNPAGRFDQAGRWYPAQRHSCCDRIRGPSRAYPYSYLVHCRTLEHVLHDHGADEEVRREVRSLEAGRRGRVAALRCARLREPWTAYKQVAVRADGALVSVYDGQTQYAPGTLLRQQARSNHGGGYYVYGSIAEASCAEFPATSAALACRRVILQVTCSGRRVQYNNGKIACSNVLVGEVVASVLPALAE
jgi:hypothetical protein